MKKFLFPALIALVTGFTMVSCNNGAYDADPENDYSDMPNPLDPANSPGNMLGTFTCKVNDVVVNFTGAYALDTLGSFYITGGSFLGDDLAKFDVLSMKFREYKGPGVYSVSDSTDDINPGYAKFRGVGDVTDYDFFDGYNCYFTVNVTEEKDKKLRGTFEGVLLKTENMFDPDTTDRMFITEGKFHVKKN